jgi:hypothetical protein
MVAELSYSSSFFGTVGTIGVLEVSIASVLTSALISDDSTLTLVLLSIDAGLACPDPASGFRGLGTGELLAEGVTLFCKAADSSQDEVDDPDSSSEDKVGG